MEAFPVFVRLGEHSILPSGLNLPWPYETVDIVEQRQQSTSLLDNRKEGQCVVPISGLFGISTPGQVVLVYLLHN